MDVAADRLVSCATREVRLRADQLIHDVEQALRRDVPAIWEDPDVARLMAESVAEHILVALAGLEAGVEPSLLSTSAIDLERTRRVARRGSPLSVMLRSFRLGQAVVLDRLLAELPKLTDDAELLSTATRRLVATATGYVDRLSEQGVATYQEERDRRLRWRLSMVNDASMRIGTTLDIVRTTQELADLATEYFADLVTVDLLDSALRGHDPQAQGPLMLCRVAQRAAEGVPEPAIRPQQLHTWPNGTPPARALLTGRPVQHRSGPAGAAHATLAVPLRARDSALGVAQFVRHRDAGAFDDEDLLLAQEIVARAAVAVDNARRYTHARSAALTLQRSLLPRHTARQSAVDIASRYLPAGGQAGVGGDWYDVIPLSGARVALVVGDVVGHGIHAAATMGRLRTAVRTLADIDLPPDELLTHLDDVVLRLSAEATTDPDPAPETGTGTGTGGDATGRDGTFVAEAGQEGGEEIGATCLYAVYDPVSGRCTLARAGHVAPVVVAVDGTADLLDPSSAGHPFVKINRTCSTGVKQSRTPGHRTVPGFRSAPVGPGRRSWFRQSRTSDLRSPGLDLPAGPPLGLGGLPFEAVEIDLPEGSVLALYTDGLIEARDHDVETGLALLRQTLARPAPSLEATCDAVLDALLPTRPDDDVALLLARTHILGGDHVASWELDADPAAVARARSDVSRQLGVWGLDELSFTTELVVSELVTNAVRYGRPPIVLRLIHDRSLLCEVSDASSTTPHLRRARVFDEGGRGLLLVAQLAEHWGTRHARNGKTVWAELGDSAGLPAWDVG
ncbi:SpoIIE family protein phosphatase [Streptomyces sp. NPDC050263]|uniref:ATP-binding SpoIIE family protein phosphatase n=1 Tax=Streptomyces sp. NPDC050263 TaxID=3155037 RepID=UPI00342DA855